VLSPHQVLCGRFEVQAFLGEGGMGQVWEALDLELRESIAIKTIRSDIADAPGVLARFKREVYATRRVTHPNVCRTFDLESHVISNSASAGAESKIIFLTMELLRGETLAQRLRRGPLPPDQLRVLALQVANALYAAHEAGIIHCDLKPANIFMTGSESRLRTVVTDFGIAKVIQLPDETASPILAEGATVAGGVAGTPLYMAPEQFQGRQCTAATDIYCYGLVLYEALTGQRLSPYSRSPTGGGKESRGPSADGTASATGTIGVPVIDPYWDNLLGNCLEIDPGDRFGHMQQVLDFLLTMPTPNSRSVGYASKASGRSLSSQSSAALLSPSSAVKGRLELFRSRRGFWYAAAILALVLAAAFVRYRKQIFGSSSIEAAPSVAVLPFVNVGNEPDLSAMSEGFADALTNDLAQVSGLRVPSQSVVRGLGKSADLRSASQQLGVDHVVTGSISREAEELHIQVELVDAKTEMQLWGQSYTSKPTELASLQEDIAQEVAFRLQTDAKHSAGTVARAHIPVPAAEEAYRKGEEAMAERTPEGFDKAVNYFEQAIDADPQHAAAMAELSRTYSMMAYNNNRPEAPVALLNQAEKTARRALRVDSTSAEAYGSLASAELLRDYNWTAAEKDYKRAIELDPTYLPGHSEYALPLLTAEGRFAEAHGQYAYADREQAKSVATKVSEALTAYYERRFEESALAAEESRKQAPGIWFVIELLAADYISMGKPEKAVALITSAPSLNAGSVRDAMLGIAYAKLGRKDEALSLLRRVDSSGETDTNYHRACLAAALGLNDKAMDYLETAYTNKESDILFVAVDPMLDSLKKDPRFQLLLSKMNLHEPSNRTQGESK
jgi:eukaryotic-like serine/threonine-protein kinase